MSTSVLVEDPIVKEWKPTKKQEQFISLPFEVFEALYGGAAGAGKSELLILLPLIYRFHEHPLFKGLIMRRTFPELDAEIIKRSVEWYPSTGAVYNESKREWKWQRGASVKFGHAEKEQDVRKYDSAQYNYFAPDEATSFTEFQYRFITFSRVRSRSSDLPAIVRPATNPGNIGHVYFRDRFVAPLKDSGKIIIKDKRTGLLRAFIQATIRDNPYLLAANPQYIQMLENLPEAEKRAKLLGDWYTFTGQVFKEFRVDPLPDEPEHAKHVIEPFKIPSWWPRIIGIDWGFEAMTWIGWGAVSPKGQVFIYREYAEKGKLTKDWIADLINHSCEDTEERDAIQTIRICHSAAQNRGEPLNIINQVKNAVNEAKIKASVGLGSKGRINKKLNLHEYLRWAPKVDVLAKYGQPFSDDVANRLFRLYGTQKHEEYLAIYKEQPPEDNLPKLQLFEGCNEVIKAIPACVYEDRAINGKSSEDVKEFEGDDPYDGICILLDAVKDYLVEHATELGKIKEEEEARVKLYNSGDQTAFYRRMEILEKSNKQEFGVRRASRFRRR